MNLHVCFRMSFTTHDRCPCTTPEVSLTKHASNLLTEVATTTNQSPDDDPGCQLSKTDLYGVDETACRRSNVLSCEDSDTSPPFISKQFEKLNTIIDKLESVGKNSENIQQKLTNKEHALREKISAAKCHVVSQLDELESNMQLGENNKQTVEQLRNKLIDS